jgi:fucose permease
MFSFVILGLFTSSIGVMLPPLSTHYELNDVSVSFIFLAVPFGYIIGSSLNPLVHRQFGQRGIAVFGPALHITSAVALGLHPKFGVLLVAFALNAMGSGTLDGSWCAYAASMENPGFVSGLLHGSFSVGAAVGPFFAGGLMEKGMNWWVWYYGLVGFRIVSFFLASRVA